MSISCSDNHLTANDEFNVVEPILPTNYHISYNSIEANRQEVCNFLQFCKKMYVVNIYIIYLQDLHSLRNGSLDYSQADEPTYRVCVEESKNLGKILWPLYRVAHIEM